MERECSKSFSDASDSSNTEKEIIKQINMLKPFNMEPCKAVPKKLFVSEEESNCEGEISLTPQDKIGNINWWKCGCDCKLMLIFAESFCLLFRLKSRSARGASRHSAFMGNCPSIVTRISLIYLVDEFFFLFLV